LQKGIDCFGGSRHAPHPDYYCAELGLAYIPPFLELHKDKVPKQSQQIAQRMLLQSARMQIRLLLVVFSENWVRNTIMQSLARPQKYLPTRMECYF
jgi:hypothetical protein